MSDPQDVIEQQQQQMFSQTNVEGMLRGLQDHLIRHQQQTITFQQQQLTYQADMSTKITMLLDLVSQAKGGWKVLIFIGSGVAAILGWVAAHFFHFLSK